MTSRHKAKIMSHAKQIEKISQADDQEAEWMDFPPSPMPEASVGALLQDKSVLVVPTLRYAAGRHDQHGFVLQQSPYRGFGHWTWRKVHPLRLLIVRLADLLDLFGV